MNIENILGSNYRTLIRFISLYDNQQERVGELEFEELYNSNLTESKNEEICLNEIKQHIKNDYPDVHSFSFNGILYNVK